MFHDGVLGPDADVLDSTTGNPQVLTDKFVALGEGR